MQASPTDWRVKEKKKKEERKKQKQNDFESTILAMCSFFFFCFFPLQMHVSYVSRIAQALAMSHLTFHQH